MTVKLLSQHHLEFLGLRGGCTGSTESALVKMPHCWKSRIAALFVIFLFIEDHGTEVLVSLSNCIPTAVWVMFHTFSCRRGLHVQRGSM